MTDTSELPTGILIGDEWISESTAGTMPHFNPADGKLQAQFPVAGLDEIERGVAAARRALVDWKQMPYTDRAACLRRIAAGFREHAKAFEKIGTLEMGAPVMFSGHAPGFSADWFDYYAGWVDKIHGEVIPTPNAFDYTLVEPLGVAAILLTWNGPTGLIGMKVAAALAAGCTVVLKPPELAPFSSSLFGQICLESGLPPGVLNIMPGGPESGEHLVAHSGVDKVSFTGGPDTGRRIQAACAQSLTPLVLELGGKSANIVAADADLEAAAMVAAMGVIALNGQVCVAPTRLLVQAAAYEEMVDRVKASLASVVPGDPLDPATMMGPMISERACERVVDMVEGARSRGDGKVALLGERKNVPGFFVGPTLLVDVDNSSPIAQKEVFGPVLVAMPYESDDEAVGLANDSEFGLAAYVHTTDLARAHRMAAALDVGNVAINGGSPVGGPWAPFGGFKNSGYGKEGGRDGLLEFTRLKNVNIKLS